MSPNPRVTREVPTDDPVRNQEIVDNLATLYKKGMECVAELQSRTIDCAVQHNKETIEIWKQMMERLPWAPRVNVFEGLAGTLDRFAEVQKAVINLGVDQTRAVLEMAKERTTAASKTADSLSKFTQQSIERSMTAQKKVVEAAVAETKSAFDNARERFVVPGGEAMTETLRHGFDAVINAQKDLLETATSRWAPASETVPAA